MKLYLPAFWPGLACLSALAGLVLAWFTPQILLPALLPTAPVVLLLALAARFPAQAVALWLAALATCPDMWLGDIIGAGSAIIASDKAAGLLLLVFCLFRYGARWDRYNPALAFPVMWAAGYAHGVWPGLIWTDSLRSLIGSVAPFAFSFARLPPLWCRLVIRTVIASPFIILGFGCCLAGAGLRPLYSVEDGALRLGASTHPAFLAGFTLISLYALLVEQARRPRRGLLVLLAVDILVMLATGARAPLAIALGLILLVTLTLPQPAWRWSSRVPVLLLILLAPAAAVLAAPMLGFVRLLSLARQGDMIGLSHRMLIWPVYEAAFLRSPWLGWGTGTGKILVPLGTLLWRLLGTNAAHDEYLRIAVEGGALGLTLLVLLFILWLRQAAQRIGRPEAWVMRLVFLAFALHSATDNTLIATTASLMFAWVSAVFARGEDWQNGLVSGRRKI
ncbi:O-antigen ligase family protein [Acidisoma cellulosilytica]|uniref:O-antigen ligase family protein n=1 Tax=Acidisoma cellulosilyticum TaxID=2802395 RepID=A0A963Z678_9PROT|nr:O-antigen ligase family protein [Acidisoma cellulosilyticum]MCB8883609.1 O-antigen ligase family protein [Acidisoma cellulosilyticum]